MTTKTLRSPASPQAEQTGDAGLATRARQLLRERFGLRAFRPQQEEIVCHIAAGGDALVLMPTGGGKSLCYQLPALMREGLAVVFSPLIALMDDQVQSLTARGIPAAALHSGHDETEQDGVLDAAFTGRIKLLFVAPERLPTPRFMALLDALYLDGRLALFAIDEAHCVWQWGHDFRPEYLQLALLPLRYPTVPRVALTATADKAARDEIVARLALHRARLFLSSFDRTNLFYAMRQRSGDGKRQLLAAMRKRPLDGSTIVYCGSRAKTERVSAWLAAHGVPALAYHAGLDATTRRARQHQFLHRNGLVMVATIAFGMGIDKPDVRFVAHLDLPRSLEGYYQETGRAGRDGEPAYAQLYWRGEDAARWRLAIEQNGQLSPEQRSAAHARLDALAAVILAHSCRRQPLLAYFGETIGPCGRCDHCLNPPQRWDAREAAQMALSAVYRTGQRHGANTLIDVLRGNATSRVVSAGYDRLQLFGIGVRLPRERWEWLFQALLLTGALTLTERGGYALTERSRPLLKGEAPWWLPLPQA
ncbi:DNA helicase RecQ [Hydrogenophilus islandicus]